MDEDLPIRVLHYHNPHLLWIEVKKQDTFAFRQVGLFGVVPGQASFVDGELVCAKSERWDQRANEIVQEFLDTKHLYFKSTYRMDEDDNQNSSIFVNQPHIFGEIYSLKSDGVKNHLINDLNNSVNAYKSKNEFWQMLNAGKINTYLEDDEALDVFKKIIQFYEAKGIWQRKKETFFQHITPAQISKLNNIQSAKLTIQNLQKHEILTNNKHLSIEDSMVIEKPKNRQDINYDSKDLKPVEFIEDVIKRFTVVQKPSENKNNIESKNMQVLQTNVSKITVYDEEIYNNGSTGEPVALGRANSRSKKTDETKKMEELLKMKEKFKRGTKKTSSTISQNSHENEGSPDLKYNEETKRPKEYMSPNDEKSSNNASRNIKHEKLIAYGPPMNNLQCLVRKQIQITDEKPTEPRSQEDNVNFKQGNVKWDDDEPNFDENDEFNGKKSDFDIVDGNVEKKQGFDRHFMKSRLEKLKEIQKQGSAQDSDKNNDNVNAEETNSKDEIEKKVTLPKKSRSKLLDLMRKRAESIFNDSLSSTDSNSNYDSIKKSIKNTKNDNTKSTKAQNFDSDNLNGDNSIKKDFDTTKSSINISTSEKDEDSDTELEKIHAQLNPKSFEMKKKEKKIDSTKPKIHVNPYKNLDGSKSVFVENLVEPLLLAHSKMNIKILPQTNLRDIPFKIEIHNTLRNMQVKAPSRLQSVTWPYILRGHSMIMISAPASGKTLGYLPAICNIVLDYNFEFTGLGPICIIVCSTALSVAHVANECRMFLNLQRVLAVYPGLDHTKLVTDLVNGCDVLVSTPSLLYRLLQAEIGVDLRRLTTVVLEDCERLSSVFEMEVKAIQLYVKKMLKTRTDKQVKVQYILASRKWCNFMNPLAKKAPDTIITFAAFHECVLYSKVNTSVSYVKKDKKVDAVVDFLKETDESKLCVIVCRTDDEVELLETKIKHQNYNVVACNNQMTIHDLYKLRSDELSSVLICCDTNLNHLNIRYANYLVHYSMPALYTQFCARFAVLNERYPSIFGPQNKNVKIKILLEETNVEQLPKILHFVKRCSSQVPEVLNDVARIVLEQKELTKAHKIIPICDSLMTLGECADMYACQERHAILKGFDEPKPWMPNNGIITFKIIHYNTAVSYSARLLTHVIGENKTKYPETYGTLCMKLGMFFSKENNKRLHGEPKAGDICAISIRKNFIARCQVLKIIDYENEHAKNVIINIIDEEQITVVNAVELYYLPDKFKDTETYVARVRLANIRPLDKDVTYSLLAKNTLKKITDTDEQLYLRGRVVMMFGNTIFVETLEACADLTALCETVVKHDFKNMLLDSHAIPDPEHLVKLQKLCDAGHLELHKTEVKPTVKVKNLSKPVTIKEEIRWAHLDKNDWTEVDVVHIINAEIFFVCVKKYTECIHSLITDIRQYILENNPEKVENVNVKDIVLAEWPDDKVYKRAMIEKVIDDTKVTCFFVDTGEWSDVAISKLKPIPQKFISQIPFQTIECRLVGIRPAGVNWTEFSNNWLYDNCFEDDKDPFKRMFAKYYTKEKAEVTGGNKYGVVLVDSTTDDDVVINKRMVELNLAAKEKEEFEYLEEPLNTIKTQQSKSDTSTFEDDLDMEEENNNDEAEEEDNKNERWDISSDMLQMVRALVGHSKVLTNTNTTIFNDEVFPTEKGEKIETSRPKNKELFEITDAMNVVENDKNIQEVTKNIAYAAVTKCAKIKETESSLEDLKTPDLEESKSKVEIVTGYVDDETDKDSKDPDDLDTSGVIESISDTDILKGEIKDVSIYDSDDTVSITSYKKELNKLAKKKDVSVFLDSDDTQSILTENELNIEENKNKLDKSILDSDDSETVEYCIHKKLQNGNIDIETTDNIHEAIKIFENMNGNDDKVSKITSGGQNSKPTIFKGTLVTEINQIKNDPKDISEQLKKEVTEETKNKELNEAVDPKDNPNLTDTLKNNTEEVKNKKTVNNKIDIKMKGETITITQTSEPTRRPQVVWRQDINTITIKINLAVENYILEVGDKSLKFSAYQNEVKYAFDVELYGVVDTEKTEHSNKGLYILVKLIILLKKPIKWLKLTKGIHNWIVYDKDAIDTSSDEETPYSTKEFSDIMSIARKKHMQLDDEYDDDRPDDIDS